MSSVIDHFNRICCHVLDFQDDLSNSLFPGGITAKARTSGDHGHAAGTGRGRHGLGQVPEPNTGTVAKAVVKAGEFVKHLPHVCLNNFIVFPLS